MIALFTLALATATATADSVAAPPPSVRDLPVGVTYRATPDTVLVRPRRKALQLSDAYGTRLAIHKWASYATLPLFAAQAVVGERLYRDQQNGLARSHSMVVTHDAVAVGLGALFAVNTVTGGLNWWETRHDGTGRAWRTAHALLMLAADGGFAATASMGSSARYAQADRDRHKTWAIGSASVALASYLMMLSPIRRDQ
jgi:hypothetical protein